MQGIFALSENDFHALIQGYTWRGTYWESTDTGTKLYFDKNSFHFVILYAITKRYGIYRTIKVENLESEYEDVDTLEEFDIIPQSASDNMENPASRMLILDFSTITPETFLSVAKSEAKRQYSQVYKNTDNLLDSQELPTLIYLDGMESYQDYLCYSAKLAEASGQCTLLFYNPTGFESIKEELYNSAVSDYASLSDNIAVLQSSTPEIQGLISSRKDGKYRQGYDAFLAAKTFINYLQSLNTKYYFVGAYIHATPMLNAAMAVGMLKYDIRPIFSSHAAELAYLHEVISMHTFVFGEIKNQLEHYFQIAPVNSLRLAFTKSFATPFLAHIYKSSCNLKYNVLPLSTALQYINASGEIINGIDASDYGTIPSFSENSLPILNDSETGLRSSVKLISIVEYFGLNNPETEKRAIAERYLYGIFRLVDQFANRYQRFTFLRNAILFDIHGTKFIGYAEMQPQTTSNLVPFLNDKVLVQNMETGMQLLETKHIYDMEEYDENGNRRGRPIKSILINLVQRYTEAHLDPNKISVIAAMPPTDKECDMLLWNTCTILDKVPYRGEQMADMQLANGNIYYWYKNFLPLFFREAKPYGFRFLPEQASPITLYGDIKSELGSSATILYADLFKTPIGG